MFNIFFSLFMFVLLAICVLMTVIILMQKPSENAGMGAALGGGAAESVFGGETSNVLLKYTVRISVIFFVLSFLLYVIGLSHSSSAGTPSVVPLPNIGGPASPTTGATSSKTTTTTTGTAPSADSSLKLPAVKPTSTETGTSTTAPATSAPAASAPASSAPAAKN